MEASDTLTLPSTRPSSVDIVKNHQVTAAASASAAWITSPSQFEALHSASQKLIPSANPLAGTHGSYSQSDGEDREYINHVLQPMKLSKIMDDVMELKLFLETAPVHFSPHDVIHRFRLHTEEEVSCVRWNNVFYMTGTDIVRCLTYRFAAFGRTITNRKKFEEGIFSDLRNLKCNEHAKLEGAKSEFLSFLYKHNCIRTKKKQKVFHWYSIRHDQLFIDALERDLKKESCAYRHTSDQSATQAVSEPALSFKYDHKQTLNDQISGAVTELPSPLAQIVNATMTSATGLTDAKAGSTSAHQPLPAKSGDPEKCSNVTVLQVASDSGEVRRPQEESGSDRARVIVLDPNQVPSMALPPGTGPAGSTPGADPSAYTKSGYGGTHPDEFRGVKRPLDPEGPGLDPLHGYGVHGVKQMRTDPGRTVQPEESPYKAILTLLSIGSNPTRNARSIMTAQSAVKVLMRYFPNFRPDLSGESLGMVLLRIQGLYLSEEEMGYVENALALVASAYESAASNVGPRGGLMGAPNPYVLPVVPFIENDLCPEPIDEGYGHLKTEDDLGYAKYRYGPAYDTQSGMDYANEYYDAPPLKDEGYDLLGDGAHASYGNFPGYHQSPRYRYPPGYSQHPQLVSHVSHAQHASPYGNFGPRQPGPALYYDDYVAEPEPEGWPARQWYPNKPGIPRTAAHRPQGRREEVWQ